VIFIEESSEANDQEEEVVLEMEEVDNRFMGGGMFVGAVTGIAFGFAFGSPALGSSMGLSFGLAIGIGLGKLFGSN